VGTSPRASHQLVQVEPPGLPILRGRGSPGRTKGVGLLHPGPWNPPDGGPVASRTSGVSACQHPGSVSGEVSSSRTTSRKADVDALRRPRRGRGVGRPKSRRATSRKADVDALRRPRRGRGVGRPKSRRDQRPRCSRRQPNRRRARLDSIGRFRWQRRDRAARTRSTLEGPRGPGVTTTRNALGASPGSSGEAPHHARRFASGAEGRRATSVVASVSGRPVSRRVRSDRLPTRGSPERSTSSRNRAVSTRLSIPELDLSLILAFGRDEGGSQVPPPERSSVEDDVTEWSISLMTGSRSPGDSPSSRARKGTSTSSRPRGLCPPADATGDAAASRAISTFRPPWRGLGLGAGRRRCEPSSEGRDAGDEAVASTPSTVPRRRGRKAGGSCRLTLDAFRLSGSDGDVSRPSNRIYSRVEWNSTRTGAPRRRAERPTSDAGGRRRAETSVSESRGSSPAFVPVEGTRWPSRSPPVLKHGSWSSPRRRVRGGATPADGAKATSRPRRRDPSRVSLAGRASAPGTRRAESSRRYPKGDDLLPLGGKSWETGTDALRGADVQIAPAKREERRETNRVTR